MHGRLLFAVRETSLDRMVRTELLLSMRELRQYIRGWPWRKYVLQCVRGSARKRKGWTKSAGCTKCGWEGKYKVASKYTVALADRQMLGTAARVLPLDVLMRRISNL
jgi:hypothetical protein